MEGPGWTVLVDTGGEAPDEAPGRRSDFLEQLAALGQAPEDVQGVVLTHAHLDHIGYNTRRAGDGWTPTFPNATYWIQRVEAETVRQSDPVRWERYFGPLERAGCLGLVAGDKEVSPGLTCLATPGHTAGHQSVLVACGSGRSAIYVGDLAVTKLHVEHPDWHPAWCASPEDELRSKDRLVRLALERDAVIIFGHDPHVHWGRIRTSAREGRVEVVPVAEEGLPRTPRGARIT